MCLKKWRFKSFSPDQDYEAFKFKWNLSFEECLKIFSSKCNYCGIEPNKKINVYLTKQGKYRTSNIERADKAWVVYNGIDRVDNEKGYIKTNVVSCCYRCNLAKHNQTLKEFQEWIERIVNFNREKNEKNNLFE